MIQSTKSIMVSLILVLGFAGCGTNLTGQSGNGVNTLNDGVELDPANTGEVEEAALGVLNDSLSGNPSFISRTTQGGIVEAAIAPRAITNSASLQQLVGSNQLQFFPINSFAQGGQFATNNFFVDSVSSYVQPQTILSSGSSLNPFNTLGSHSGLNTVGVGVSSSFGVGGGCGGTSIVSVPVGGVIQTIPFSTCPFVVPVASVFANIQPIVPAFNTVLNTCGGAFGFNGGCGQPVILSNGVRTHMQVQVATTIGSSLYTVSF